MWSDRIYHHLIMLVYMKCIQGNNPIYITPICNSSGTSHVHVSEEVPVHV